MGRRGRVLISTYWRIWLLVAIGAIIFGAARTISAGPPDKKPRESAEQSIDVLFSPDGGCEDRIVAEVGEAGKHVRVQMYIFNSKAIAEAIIAAKKRGVVCEIIADKSEEAKVYGRLPSLSRAGVKVLIDAEHEVANNKIMLIDDDTLITGSYNYTKAAEEKNAENLLIIKNHPEVFGKYSANYDAHKAHAKPYQRP